MIGALQKMDRVGADCEERYREVLAQESSRQSGESVLDPPSPPRRVARRNRPAGQDANRAEGEGEEDELISPEQLLSSFFGP